MERMTTRLRALIRRSGLIVAPACFDPFSARLVARTGFPCAALGGFALGAESAISEPLLTMTEVVEADLPGGRDGVIIERTLLACRSHPGSAQMHPWPNPSRHTSRRDAARAPGRSRPVSSPCR